MPIGILIDELGAPTVVMASGLLIFLFWSFVGVFLRAYRLIELPGHAGSEIEVAEVEP